MTAMIKQLGSRAQGRQLITQHTQHRQQGAVLMIAMVMIFILSILGISSMRGATLESQLANNSMQKEMTFQSAESSTDVILGREFALRDIICKPKVTEVLTDFDQIEEQKTVTTLEDAGRTHPLWYELNGPVSARRFVVTGFSELPAANTSTTIAQGVMLLGASDNSGDC
jgi:hypothetical protein